ncbi:MAG: hypothetical protein N2Z75_09095, partial [Meiothermus sp.]|nr:hypothetical protein [Meiothermus sp.]
MRSVVLLILVFASLALAQPRMAALSDLQIQWAEAQCPKPRELGVSFSGLTNPQRDGQTEAGREALRQNLSGPMKEMIAALEQQLRELPPDDPSRPQLQQALNQLKAEQARTPSPAASSPSTTPQAALANLRRALNAVAGPGSLRLMETQPEYREAAAASRNAALAAVMGKPQLALGLLLRAQQLEPRNPAHLVNLAGIANYYGLFAEALALSTAAEGLNPPAALR